MNNMITPKLKHPPIIGDSVYIFCPEFHSLYKTKNMDQFILCGYDENKLAILEKNKEQYSLNDISLMFPTILFQHNE